MLFIINFIYDKKKLGEKPSRWRRSKMQRSPSSPQIHQKYIYMWNSSYRTLIERRQKTSDFPKGKKLATYLGRAKEKTDKRIGMGPEPTLTPSSLSKEQIHLGDLHAEVGTNTKPNPRSFENKEEKGKSLPAASGVAD